MADNPQDCIFCRIVAGEIPCYRIYEDSQFLAFLDVAPVSRGHTLIIPKNHYRWVWEVPDVGRYFETATKVLKLLKTQLHPSLIHYLTWGEIPHAHIHIIPRYKDDPFGPPYDKIQKPSIPEEQMKQLAEQIFAASHSTSP